MNLPSFIRLPEKAHSKGNGMTQPSHANGSGNLVRAIHPSLWFDGNAEEAAEYYTAIFPNSNILNIARYSEAGPLPAGTVMTVEFELGGLRFLAINGGPQFHFSEAISFVITCKDQAEIDYYWERLTDGGEEGPCGWCKDKFGLSWQVVPAGMSEIFGSDDPDRARRASEAMFKMKKLDVATLRGA
jgi:predicted 3-demethylubiquinone-9 3-methyltransferase (glyoxalase superfamily)